MHYGVKGMKWGVRKKYYKSYMDRDRTIKEGSRVQNISFGKAREIGDKPVYATHTSHDNNAYAGNYADSLNSIIRGDPYKNSIILTRDVKIPSQKKAVETFVEMYDRDPKGMAESISRAHADVLAFNGISKVYNYNVNRINKKFEKNGKDWVESKGYTIFNQSLMSDKDTKARNEYFNLLGKKGYDAILDVNDVQSGYSDDPIIFIKPNNTMKNAKSSKLTADEIDLANARYRYDEALKKRGIIDTLTYGEYRKAKKNLERAERNQVNR